MTVGFVHIRGGNNSYLADNLADFVRLAEGILEKRLPPLVEDGYRVVCERCFAETGKQLVSAYERAIQLREDRL